ncbi:FtsK/SpoIIIE domain-containing protein [Jongsikchunia kroppenstedtii]|uniref:FtsK/SpoIIIE domain-containing protein n=1 Tax=Jongsikchunia kroppenstedtii TaxID=1121721 RepID=UPI00036DE747|nr:FtsK/SpoIIIE domain-containing protein [Jongsikchunia kroppenstedtii]
MNDTPSTTPNTGGKPDTTADEIAGSIATGLWRLARFILVWAWRLPIVSVPAAGLSVIYWQTGAVWTIVAAIATGAAIIAWSVYSPVSLRRYTIDRIRFHCLVWRRYRSWTAVCTDCGLSRTRGDQILVPALVRVQFTATDDVLTVRPLRGQTLTDFRKAADALADAFGADTITVTRPEPAVIQLAIRRQQPLAEPITPASGPVSGSGSARQWSLHLGLRGDRTPWRLPILGTHLLIGGVTGSGKGSVLWSLIGAAAASTATGEVQLWVADPKGGMEFGAGTPLFTRFAYTPETIAEMLADATALMTDRAQRLRGVTRSHTPTAADPLIIVVIDELAALTAFCDRTTKTAVDKNLGLLLTQGRAVGVSVVAAVQDPSKEIVPMRQLFPARLALRMAEATQTTMILGPGAIERGAAAHQIPDDQPGTGYLAIDGAATPILVRAFHYTDHDITALIRRYGRTTDGQK